MSALAWRGTTVAGILHGIDLEVATGELVAIVGPNGAGKTTMLRTALALLSPSAGSVALGGRDVATLGARERAAEVAWLPQRHAVQDAVPVEEVVAAGRFRFGESHARSLEAARHALDEVGLGRLAERPATTLSGGEAQRVALATLVAQEAHTWLLDEPANHLDPRVQIDIYRFLARRWRGGRTLVAVTHDVNLLGHLGEGTRVVGLADGRLAWQLRLEDPELPDALGALFGVTAHAVQIGGMRHLVLGPSEPA